MAKMFKNCQSMVKKMVKHVLKWSKKVQNHQKYFIFFMISQKWSKIGRNIQKLAKMIKNVLEWSKMVISRAFASLLDIYLDFPNNLYPLQSHKISTARSAAFYVSQIQLKCTKFITQRDLHIGRSVCMSVYII